MTPRLDTVTIGITADLAAHVSGTKRCGSVWGCPHCAPTIREQRAAKIDALLARALEDGCTVVFVTATAAHTLLDPLDSTWTGVQRSWSKAFSGRVVAAGNEAGYLGMVRAFDVTDGVNGWHPHIHAAIVFEPGTTRRTVNRFLNDRMVDYRSNLAAAGMYASEAHGWDARTVTKRTKGRSSASSSVASYLCKVTDGWGVGLELARMDLKSGRRGGSTPFEILTRAVIGRGRGAKVARARWREYEETSSGKRLVVTGRRLAARYGVDPDELTDEELAQADDAAAFVVVWPMPGEDWWRICKAGHAGELIAHLIAAAAEIQGKSPP